MVARRDAARCGAVVRVTRFFQRRAEILTVRSVCLFSPAITPGRLLSHNLVLFDLCLSMHPRLSHLRRPRSHDPDFRVFAIYRAIELVGFRVSRAISLSETAFALPRYSLFRCSFAGSSEEYFLVEPGVGAVRNA